RPPLAVQARGEDLRHRRLPGPAGADEQVGMVDLALRDRVAQGTNDRLLPDHLVKRAGAVPAVQRPLLCLWLLLWRHRWPESTHARAQSEQPPERIASAPMTAISRRLAPLAGALLAIAVMAVLLRVIAGVAFANYD